MATGTVDDKPRTRCCCSSRVWTLLGLLVISILLTVISNEVLVALRMRWVHSHLDAFTKNSTFPPTIDWCNGGLTLTGQVFDVDISSLQVQISWMLTACDSYAFSGDGCGLPNTAVDIHFGGSDVANISYDPDTSVLYRTDGSAYIPVQATLATQTQHLFDMQAPDFSRTLLNQPYSYPFDKYSAHILVHALHAETKDNFPLVMVAMVQEAADNFEVYLSDETFVHTMTPAVGNSSSAIAVGIVIQRTLVTRLFVIALFSINWLLTAAVLYVAVSANDGVAPTDSVIVLPVTVILTILGLRALWVGAPTFGVQLDNWGIFPQMIIVSLASIYLLVVTLRRPKTSAGTKASASVIPGPPMATAGATSVTVPPTATAGVTTPAPSPPAPPVAARVP